MWKDYEWSLAAYIHAMCNEWMARGYKDTIKARILLDDGPINPPTPPWIGGPIHKNHRGNLYRKDPVYYAQFENVGPVFHYIWPVDRQ